MPRLGEITFEGTLFDKHAFSQDIDEVAITLKVALNKSEDTGNFLHININIPNHYPEQKI